MENKESVQKYLDNWDNNIPIKCVNMGGLNEAYDKAIQSLTMEFLRESLNKDVVLDESQESRDFYVKFCDDFYDNLPYYNENKGVSGAMFDAARHVAYQFLTYGLDHQLELADTQYPDRIEYWTKN